MGFSLFCAAAILFVIVEVSPADAGDCGYDQIKKCAEEVFYGLKQNMTFSQDEKFHEDRCHAQLKCYNDIQCLGQRCFKERGSDLITCALQGGEYEVMHLCHPNADPGRRDDYKKIADCNTAIWPKVNECQKNLDWGFEIGRQKGKDGYVQMCCAILQCEDCVSAASQVPQCNDFARKHYQDITFNYLNCIADFLCSKLPNYEGRKTCQGLPPLKVSGPPPHPFFENLFGVAGSM